MKYTSELYSLTIISTATALMWVPYVLTRMTTHGVMRAIGTPGAGYPADAPWADRARRAHINAIENLAHATNVHPIDQFCNAPSALRGARKYSDLARALGGTHGCSDQVTLAARSSPRWENKT